jgi:hypothetical protein
MNLTDIKEPFYGGKCYACDKTASGLRDRRPEGKMLEMGCARHADPKIRTYKACMYCAGIVRRGGWDVDGNVVHQACHTRESR